MINPKEGKKSYLLDPEDRKRLAMAYLDKKALEGVDFVKDSPTIERIRRSLSEHEVLK